MWWCVVVTSKHVLSNVFGVDGLHRCDSANMDHFPRPNLATQILKTPASLCISLCSGLIMRHNLIANIASQPTGEDAGDAAENHNNCQITRIHHTAKEHNQFDQLHRCENMASEWTCSCLRTMLSG